jgi:hypothetical protein
MAWILHDLFLAMPPVDCERRLKRRLANAATTGLPCSIVSRRGKATGLSIINSFASYRAEICPQAIRNGCRKQSTLDESFVTLNSEQKARLNALQGSQAREGATILTQDFS